MAYWRKKGEDPISSVRIGTSTGGLPIKEGIAKGSPEGVAGGAARKLESPEIWRAARELELLQRMAACSIPMEG